MINVPSIREITDKATRTFRRFPLTLIWAIIGSLYCIYLFDDTTGERIQRHAGAALTFVLGVPWLLAARFVDESSTKQHLGYVIKGVVLLLLLLFYLHWPNTLPPTDNPIYVIRFFLFFLAGHLFVLFAPFVLRWNKAAYWNYLYATITAVLRSAFFSGVLFLGLVLALLAIDALFDIEIRWVRYWQLFVFCLGIVHTWIYLSDLPRDLWGNTSVVFTKALDVFVNYILIPLVLLYLVILYAYGFKILIQWELPEGWVSYLVTALALLGFIVHVMIDPIREQSKSWTIRYFYPWFHLLLLPLIILLFVAIFRRIGDYGITENRYFVLLIAVWILGMVHYLLLAKKQRLAVLPLTLFILAVLSSLGFWGAFQVSLESQTAQFKKVYENVTAKDGVADTEEFQQLKSILDYMDDRDALSQLDLITGVGMERAFRDSISGKFAPDEWLDTSVVLDSLGITLNPNASNPNNPLGTYYNYYQNWELVQDLPITGYDFFAVMTVFNEAPSKMGIGDYEVAYAPDDWSFELHLKSLEAPLLSIPIHGRLEKLTRYGVNLKGVSPDDLVWESENDTLSLRLLVTDLGFYAKKDSLGLARATVFLFLKQP